MSIKKIISISLNYKIILSSYISLLKAPILFIPKTDYYISLIIRNNYYEKDIDSKFYHISKKNY